MPTAHTKIQNTFYEHQNQGGDLGEECNGVRLHAVIEVPLTLVRTDTILNSTRIQHSTKSHIFPSIFEFLSTGTGFIKILC